MVQIALQERLKKCEYIKSVYLVTEEIPSLLTLQRIQLAKQYSKQIKFMYTSLNHQLSQSKLKLLHSKLQEESTTTSISNDQVEQGGTFLLDNSQLVFHMFGWKTKFAFFFILFCYFYLIYCWLTSKDPHFFSIY